MLKIVQKYKIIQKIEIKHTISNDLNSISLLQQHELVNELEMKTYVNTMFLYAKTLPVYFLLEELS